MRHDAGGRVAPDGHGRVAEGRDGRRRAERVAEPLGPAQHALLLGHAVRRVDQGQALGLRHARLVVLDVAGDQHVGDLGDAAGDGLGSGAGQHGHAAHLAPAVARVAHRRQAQHRRDLGGQRRERGRSGQRAEPAEAQRGDLVVQRDEVEGRLLVGMRGDVGAGDAAAQPPREHDLDAQLVHGLVAARHPGRRLRGLAAEEGALPADRPRAVLVLADHAGAGGEERLAHEVGVVHGHEPDELQHVGGRRRQRHDGLQVEQLREHVGHPAARLVQAGVRGDDGHALPRRAQREPAGLGVVRETLERVEDQRVVTQDDAARRGGAPRPARRRPPRERRGRPAPRPPCRRRCTAARRRAPRPAAPRGPTAPRARRGPGGRPRR